MNRLSDTLRAAADEPVDLDLGALHARVDHRRRRRARARAAACIVGVVAVLGGAGVAAGVGSSADGRAEDVGVDPSVTAESTSTVAEETSTSTTLTDSSSTSTEAPTTTTSPPTTAPPATTNPPTTEAPPTSAPQPTTAALGGTYDVHSVPGAGPCSSGTFAVGLAGTVAASDGGRWSRSEQGCASLVDGGYDATGIFVLTAPDGSTITGTFHSVAALPTDGVPYGYQVTGGTGAYAGATGSCQLTVRIVAGGGSLDQRQEGEITCGLAIGGTPNAGSDGVVPEVV